MRRPYRVKRTSEQLFDVEDVRKELETEISLSDHYNSIEKRKHVETFIATCQLSKLLNAIIISQKQDLFPRQWSEGSNAPSTDDSSNVNATLNDYVLGFIEAGEFDSEIKALLRSFELRLVSLNQLESTSQGTQSNSVPQDYFRVLCQYVLKFREAKALINI
jgi:hypothetical protein